MQETATDLRVCGGFFFHDHLFIGPLIVQNGQLAQNCYIEGVLCKVDIV